MRRALTLLLPASILVGCVTTPTPTETALAQPGKLLTNAFATAAPGTGLIFVKRDSIMWNVGNGCAHRIYIDGTAVAELRVAQSVSIHVKPGEHILSAELTSICHGTSETAVTLHEGETKTYRTSATGDGNITEQPTAF